MYKLEVKNVSFLYGKKTPFERCALDNVSVGFEKGKITGLIGRTGSGKSTLVNLLNGLYKADEGEILLDGVSIWERPSEISKIRYKVGLVMQYPEYQLFDETVRADIGFAPRNQGLSPEEINERVLEAARFTGVTDEMLDKSPFELSGGQKRRVAIAGILAMRPEVLVLDEPAAGLDPKGRREILGGLCEYVRQSGITLILVSHSMEDMAQLADKLLVMNKGEKYMFGTPKEIFANREKLLACGLDVPMITKVILKLRDNGVDLPQDIITVQEAAEAILKLKGGENNA